MRMTFLDESSTFEFSNSWDVALQNLSSPPVVHHVAYRGAAVTGIEQKPAFAGIVIHPAKTVLALPGWEDAFEFVDDGALHTLFDLEKLIRMLLHGSHLAMQVLGSACGSVTLEEARSILEWTVNHRHLRPAIDSAATLEADLAEKFSAGEAIDHFRRYLQGRRLAEGEWSMTLPNLVAELDDAFASELCDIATDRTKVAETVSPRTLDKMRAHVTTHPIDPRAPALAATPSNYEALSRFLVDKRMEAG